MGHNSQASSSRTSLSRRVVLGRSAAAGVLAGSGAVAAATLGSGSPAKAAAVMASVFTQNADGLLFYNPSAAAGNLVASTTSQAGTDQYGNAYLAGETSYAKVGSAWQAISLSAGSLILSTATSSSGPWTQVSGGLPTFLTPSGDSSGSADVAAINALLTAGHTVHLLPGDYYINATLSIPAGQALTGSPCGVDKNSGSMATRIHLVAGVNNHMISLSGKAAYVGYLELDGNRAHQTSQYGNGVLCLAGSNSSIIERCLIHDQYYQGIDITDSAQGISVIGCVVVNNNNDGIFIANNTSDHHISGTSVGSNGAHNIETSGYVVHIHECDIYSAGKDGILATGGGWATLITNCGIDRNQQNGIEIQSPGVTVSACTLHSNSQASNGLYSSIVVDNTTYNTTGASVEGCVFWIDGGITNKPAWHIQYKNTALAKTHGNGFQPGTVTRGNISGPSAAKDPNETG